MSILFGTFRVSRSAVRLVDQQCIAIARYGPFGTCNTKREFSTSDVCQKRGRTLAKLLGSADPILGHRSLTSDEQSWLWDRGYNASQITRWVAILHTKRADDALDASTEYLPNFLVLNILRLPCPTREVFYRMIQLFERHIERLDNSSCLYAVEALIRHALTLDPDLLSLLDAVWPTLPGSLGPYVFNRLLSKIGANQTFQTQVARTQNIIVNVMQTRHHILDRKGYQALLSSSAHDPVRYSEIQGLMTSAGYTTDDTPSRKRKQDHREVAKFFSSIRTAQTKNDYLRLSNTTVADLTSPRFWVSLFALQDNNQHVLKFCITLLEAQKISISPLLAGLMLKRCRVPANMHIVNAVVKEIASRDMCLDVSGWAEYLKCLISAGRQQEALDILVNEPGGNDIIDLPSMLRRDPSLWSVTVRALNRQRRTLFSGRKHAKYLGKVIRALKEFEVAMTPALLSNLLEAAVLSGPRAWSHKHSCDTAVALFNKHIDLGKEPWKIKADSELWTRYLLILVANEEVTLLGDAMNHMLNCGVGIEQTQLNLFSIGVWESGSFEAVQQWQEYIEESGLSVSWPSAAETWALKESLESGELQYFRA